MRKFAVVTGSSSGIGKALAYGIAAKEYDLLLVARSIDALEEIRQDIEHMYSVNVKTFKADLSTEADAKKLIQHIYELDRPLHLLVNNAGVGVHGRFLETSVQSELDMIRLNVESLYRLTKELLPLLHQQEKSGIINLSSTAAFQPVPHLAVYGATKAFVLSFSEAVQAELSHTGIHVMAVCPGPTATGFAAAAGMSSKSAAFINKGMSPQEVASGILRAYKNRETVYIPGVANRVMAHSVKFVPRNIVLTMAKNMFPVTKNR